MARILLGVSGGIAAYKALELARLATTRGPRRPGADDARGRALRRRRLLRGHRRRAGAERRVRARPDPRRLPRRPRARARPDRPPRGGRQRRRLPGRPGLGEHRSPSSRPGSPTRWSPPPSSPAPAPRLVAPAMNDRMYRDAATQANLRDAARARGHRDRARGGRARLPRRARRRAAARSRAGCWTRSRPRCPGPSGPWDGLRVLVSAGGTREPIDPVRFIGNRSSGRMGLALAERAAAPRRRGDPGRRQRRAPGAARRPPRRRRDRRRAGDGAGGRVRHRRRAADGRGARRLPARRAPPTQDRPRGDGGLELELEPTEDILAGARRAPPRGPDDRRLRRRDGRRLDERAREKLERKGADAIVFNDVSRPEIGFESAENEVVIVERRRRAPCPARLQGDRSPTRSSTGSRRFARPRGRSAPRVAPQ